MPYIPVLAARVFPALSAVTASFFLGSLDKYLTGTYPDWKAYHLETVFKCPSKWRNQLR